METQVPAAEFYLDGNFVAVTDAKGLLTMENFPAGSFNYSVVKKGYQSYKGSFTIGEGETQRLTPALERVIEQKSVQAGAGKPAPAIPPVAVPPKLTETNGARGAEVLPRVLEDLSASVPDTLPSPGQIPSEKPQANFLLFLSLIVIAMTLIILSIMARKRKRLEPQIPSIDKVIEKETVRPRTDGANRPDCGNRPDPGFIEGLKRREELLKAGFVVSKPPVVDPASMKEKEVVIVLPKEAFRFEDDK